MDTDDKKLIDVVFGRDAIRQTSVVNPDASVEGRRYNPEHLKDGGFGVTLTVDLRAMRGESMTSKQRIAVHRVILWMAINVLEHDFPVLRNPASNVIPIGQPPAETQDHVEPAASEDTDKTLPILNLFSLEIDPEVIASVPGEVVREHRFVPLQWRGDTLVVAVADRLDYFALDQLKFILSADVEQVLVAQKALDAAITKYYGDLRNSYIEELVDGAEQELLATVTPTTIDPLSEREQAAQSVAVMKLVNLVLLQGIKAKATKIIAATEEDSCVIRMEIEGTLYDMQSPPAHLGQAFMDRLKRMADVPLEEGSRGRPNQTARIELQVGGRPVNLDANFVPLAQGELAIVNVSYPKPPQRGSGEDGEGEAPISAKT